MEKKVIPTWLTALAAMGFAAFCLILVVNHYNLKRAAQASKLEQQAKQLDNTEWKISTIDNYDTYINVDGCRKAVKDGREIEECHLFQVWRSHGNYDNIKHALPGELVGVKFVGKQRPQTDSFYTNQLTESFLSLTVKTEARTN